MPTLTSSRPAPAFWQNQKTACILTLSVVFLCGTVVGAVAMNLGHKTLHRSPFWTDSGRELSIQRLQKDLDLTPAQTEQLRTILDDFGKYYQGVLASGKTNIFRILDDNQKRKFERLLNEAQDKQHP